jgi:Transposase, Mutator family
VPNSAITPRWYSTAEVATMLGYGLKKTKHPVMSGQIRSIKDGGHRNVEAELAEALGDQAAISKSTVSAICGQIKDEYTAWAQRPLDGITLDYLYLDASFFRMHPGSPAESVLAAWGITTDGKPAFIGLAPGSGESAEAWHDFLTDLTDRGLRSPLLLISDGAPGLIAAIEQAFPKALRQRCLIHRSRKESTCRRVARFAGGEEIGRRAMAGRRLAGNVARLLEERESVPDDVADGGPADVAEGVGEDVQGAHSSLVENGEQDAFAVADLLREDTGPGTGLAWAAAPLIGEAFGLGGLPGGEPSGEFAQCVFGESGQGGVG